MCKRAELEIAIEESEWGSVQEAHKRICELAKEHDCSVVEIWNKAEQSVVNKMAENKSDDWLLRSLVAFSLLMAMYLVFRGFIDEELMSGIIGYLTIIIWVLVGFRRWSNDVPLATAFLEVRELLVLLIPVSLTLFQSGNESESLANSIVVIVSLFAVGVGGSRAKHDIQIVDKTARDIAKQHEILMSVRGIL
ncbi:MAG: hypothetical protein Q4D87_05660 [Actinomycetaceae bacterium]|nr:hypothetical protein [Actinomycetaceae bacterium]